MDAMRPGPGVESLTAAASFNQAEVMTKILRKKPNLVNETDKQGSAAIHVLGQQGSIRSLNVLLGQKADLLVRDALGQTALMVAATWGNLPVLEKLLELGSRESVHYRCSSLRTALHHATEKGHASVVMPLVAAGMDPVLIDERRETPMDIAVRWGHRNVQMALHLGEELWYTGVSRIVLELHGLETCLLQRMSDTTMGSILSFLAPTHLQESIHEQIQNGGTPHNAQGAIAEGQNGEPNSTPTQVHETEPHVISNVEVAIRALRDLTKGDISELRALQNPSQVMKSMVEAAVLLAYWGALPECQSTGSSTVDPASSVRLSPPQLSRLRKLHSREHSWNDVASLVTPSFLNVLTSVRAPGSRLSQNLVAFLQVHHLTEDVSREAAARASDVCLALYDFVTSVVGNARSVH